MPPEVVDEREPSNKKIPSTLLYAKCTKPYRLKYREKVRIEFVQSLLATEEQTQTTATSSSCDGRVVPKPPPIDKDTSTAACRIIPSCREIQMIPLNDNEEHRPSKNHSHMTQGEYLRQKKQPQVIAVGVMECSLYYSCYGTEYQQQQQLPRIVS
jgi:hypothetical protein